MSEPAPRLIPLGWVIGKKIEPAKEAKCWKCGAVGPYLCQPCDEAQEAQWLEERRAEMRRTLDTEILALARAGGLPHKFLPFTPAGLDPITVRTLRRLFEDWREGKTLGLGFWGASGTQKTGAAAEAFKQFIRQRLERLAAGDALKRGPWPLWKSWPDLVDQLLSLKNDYHRQMEYQDLVNDLERTPLLVLDDLAAEAKWKNVEASKAGGELYRIVNARNERNLTIIWTSNYDTTKLAADYYEARTISRLSEMAPPVRLLGKDRRL